MMEVTNPSENRFQKTVEGSEGVDLAKERQAHEFRWGKLTNSPQIRAALTVIRDDPASWERIQPTSDEQRRLEVDTALPGETHRVGAALFAKIYQDRNAAALYDVALFEATQAESKFFKVKIEEGVNYSPLTIVGEGGVYGTILSAAILKENPDNPAFGFDAGKRRGGIWGVSGDVTLDKAWWRMNSKNRPEGRERSPLPGGNGNQNTLGTEIQNLQGPDISSGQYLTNNEFGRVITHDNFGSDNLVVNTKLVKVRPNRSKDQKGEYEQEYEDTQTGRRFFAYTDVVVQASGLGKEKLGFSDQLDFTREVLEQAAKDLREGIVTPRVLTFLQLVEVTTSNRDLSSEDFKQFGIIGTGDTSRVTEENFGGIGGIDPGVSAQLGFVKEIVEFGRERTREELAKSERPRYIGRITEFGRANGEESFARFRGVDGRVVGVALPIEQDKLVVYYRRTEEGSGEQSTTIGSIDLPRLIIAAGFEDESARIYSGLTAESVTGPQISPRLTESYRKKGSTIFYSPNSRVAKMGIARADIDGFSPEANVLAVILVDKDGNTSRKMLNGSSLTSDEFSLLDPTQIAKLEIAGNPPKFTPYFEEGFDSEIPVAEKAEGFEIYKAGACTNLAITGKERKLDAYKKVTENTKSIFRFAQRTVAFGKSLARRIPPVDGALNQYRYQPKAIELSAPVNGKTKEGMVIAVDPKANAQKLSSNLKTEALLKYLVLSKLNCVFPKGIDRITFGVKKVASPDEKSPFGLAVQFEQPLPDNPDWQIIDQFLTDPLIQRLLIRLTRDKTASAEISIGLKKGMVDIRGTSARTIKSSEVSQFTSKYPTINK